MTVKEIKEALKAEVMSGPAMDRSVSGCYVSDLLSDVLAHSKGGELWVTQHTHSNVIAVAAVKEIAAVVVVGGKTVDNDTVARAEAEGVNIIATGLSTFEVAGMVYTMLKQAGAGA